MTGVRDRSQGLFAGEKRKRKEAKMSTASALFCIAKSDWGFKKREKKGGTKKSGSSNVERGGKRKGR